MRPHRALLAALSLALVAGLVGCGDDDDDAGPEVDVTTTTVAEPGDESTTLPPTAGQIVPSEVVLLAEGADADPEGAGPGLIVDGVDVRAFAGRFLVAGDDPVDQLEDLADDLDATGGDGRVYLGDVVSSGCFVPTGVEVRRVDDDVRLVPLGLTDQPEVECARAITTVALVAVEPGGLPDADDLVFGGEPADAPVGPGRVVAFEPLGPDARTEALEVTTLSQLDSFLLDLDEGPTVASLGLDEVEPDSRRFVFVVDGCQAATAELVVDAERIVAVPRQEGEEAGERVECESEEPYLVVADVKASASGGVAPEDEL